MEYEAVAETANGTTYRVYATFDNPTDELVAVYALETAPYGGGCFHVFLPRRSGGSPCPNHQPRILRRVSVRWQYDSWFTIGSEDSNGTSDVQQVGMDDVLRRF